MGKMKEYALELEEQSNDAEADYFEHAMNNPWLDLDIKEQKIQRYLEEQANKKEGETK
tara:strand:- start:258 stop:431 length:174 start_codon:yes stop_codon:yes gene_type:complete